MLQITRDFLHLRMKRAPSKSVLSASEVTFKTIPGKLTRKAFVEKFVAILVY